MTFEDVVRRRLKAAEAIAWPADVRGLCKAAGETARRFRRGLMLNPDVEIILTCDRCGWRGPAANPLACGGCGASLAAAQSAVARARAAFARPHVR